MRFALTQKVLTFALALVAALPLVISGEIGVAFEIGFFVFWIAGWFFEPPLTRRGGFRRRITYILLTVFLVQLMRFAGGQHMARLAMELITVLLGIKLMSRGFATDYYQIVILSFLHIIAATVAMDDLMYGICFVILVGLSSPVLALSYLRQEMEQRFSPKEQDPGGSEMLGRLFRSKRIVSSGFIALSSLLSIPILIITALLFLIFPRFGFGFFGKVTEQETTVGFGDTVTLGDFDVVRMEDTVLLRLEPTEGKKDLPAQLNIKLRGAVFDLYENDTWKKSTEAPWQRFVPHHRQYLLDPAALKAPFARTFDVLLEPIEPKLLFVPNGTGIIYTYPVMTRQRWAVRPLEANLYGELQYPDEAAVGIRYQVVIAGSPPWGSPPLRKGDYLVLPPDSKRLVALAREIADPRGNAMEIADQLVAGLQTRYRYSLTLADDHRNQEEPDPLGRFLFARKSGTCEHFATALTLMLRAHGIPSRLITGFSGADWNAFGGFYSVRKRSAHSWTEAFISDRWVTLDATPSAGEDIQMAGPSAYSMLLDAVRANWHKYIVGYDLGLQGEIALGIWQYMRRSSIRTPKIPDIPWTIPIAGVVLFALILAAHRLLRKLPLKPAKPGNRKKRRAQKDATRLYDALERRLARLGFPRTADQTPNEHLRALGMRAPFAVEAAETITERYLEVRFGNTAFAEGELKTLLAKVRKIGQASQI